MRKPRGRIKLTDDNMRSLQRPYCKNGTQLDLLLPGHMQPPDRGNWNDQDHEIAHNTDDAGADEYSIWILAFCICKIIFRFAMVADTTGRNHDDDEDERVEEVPVEDEPNARMEFGISVQVLVEILILGNGITSTR